MTGCVVGNNIGSMIASTPWDGGSWSGKCFNSWDSRGLPDGVINIITLFKDHAVSGGWATGRHIAVHVVPFVWTWLVALACGPALCQLQFIHCDSVIVMNPCLSSPPV